jgi:phage virion morphogenesis protein
MAPDQKGAGKGVQMQIRAPELRDIERKLEKVVFGLAKPAPLMNIIGAVLESSTRQRFRSGVAPDGTAWKPSIRATRKGGKTLLDHGHLRDSITHDADDRAAIVGSNLIYAAIHQVGGIIRAKAGGMLTFKIPGIGWRRVAKVTIPARPYLGVSDRDRVEIVDQVERYIARTAA